MRLILRLLGATWRFWLWVLFPPLGWYVSRQARNRRRHNQVLRAARGCPSPQPGMRIVRLLESDGPFPPRLVDRSQCPPPGPPPVYIEGLNIRFPYNTGE